MNKAPILCLAAGIACIAAGIAGMMQTPAAGAAAVQRLPSGTFVIRGARVFDGERVHDRASVLVRHGRIAAFGDTVDAPAGAPVIDGAGRTVLPGLIDAHTHAFGDALERALVFGVTTELDMFTAHEAAAGWRRAQQSAEGAPARADIFSAGTLVTAPKGHGTEYGMQIPTITSPAEARAFVDARIAEGSDYIKIVFDDGKAYGIRFPSISADTLTAVVAAAKARNKLAVVHIGTQSSAMTAIEAGASGLVHIFSDSAPAPALATAARAAGVFVIPTLTVNESVTGTPSGASLVEGSPLSRFLTTAEQSALKGAFPARPGSSARLQYAFDAVRALRAAGVPILAGTDASNPGTSHGVSMHRELELLVRAGLSTQEALAAATSVPARAFGLDDRGRIAPGLRADLVLIEGNPLDAILATRNIAGVWKGGVPLERREPVAEPTDTVATTTGVISTFDEAGSEPAAAFGSGWQISTDSLMGGASTAAMTVVRPGAGGAGGALDITGTIAAGAPFPWAGPMFFPAATPMMPANLSRFREIVFKTRGDGREYQVMVFATRLGQIPAAQPFRAGAEWTEVVLPLAAFQNLDGSDIRGVLFSANQTPGAFRFAIDDVRLR